MLVLQSTLFYKVWACGTNRKMPAIGSESTIYRVLHATTILKITDPE